MSTIAPLSYDRVKLQKPLTISAKDAVQIASIPSLMKHDLTGQWIIPPNLLYQFAWSSRARQPESLLKQIWDYWKVWDTTYLTAQLDNTMVNNLELFNGCLAAMMRDLVAKAELGLRDECIRRCTERNITLGARHGGQLPQTMGDVYLALTSPTQVELFTRDYILYFTQNYEIVRSQLYPECKWAQNVVLDYAKENNIYPNFLIDTSQKTSRVHWMLKCVLSIKTNVIKQIGAAEEKTVHCQFRLRKQDFGGDKNNILKMPLVNMKGRMTSAYVKVSRLHDQTSLRKRISDSIGIAIETTNETTGEKMSKADFMDMNSQVWEGMCKSFFENDCHVKWVNTLHCMLH
jgi:hypothetical protein